MHTPLYPRASEGGVRVSGSIDIEGDLLARAVAEIARSENGCTIYARMPN